MKNRKAKIMIVDDSSINIYMVERSLKKETDAEFITTTDPTKAIELIRDTHPDVILLDVMMPEISGLEILEELRKDKEYAHTPVIFLTAFRAARMASASVIACRVFRFNRRDSKPACTLSNIFFSA